MNCLKIDQFIANFQIHWCRALNNFKHFEMPVLEF